MNLRDLNKYLSETVKWVSSGGSETWHDLYTEPMRQVLDSIEKKLPDHLVVTRKEIYPRREKAEMYGNVKGNKKSYFVVKIQQEDQATKHRVRLETHGDGEPYSEERIYHSITGQGKSAKFVLDELKWFGRK